MVMHMLIIGILGLMYQKAILPYIQEDFSFPSEKGYDI